MNEYDHQLAEVKKEWTGIKKRLRDAWRVLIGKEEVKERTLWEMLPKPQPMFNIFFVKCVDCGHELKIPSIVESRWDSSLVACISCGGRYEVKQ